MASKDILKSTPSRGDRPAESPRFRVGIAQFAPVYMEKAASLARALELLQDAKRQGVQLLAFGETWLPGYPAWLDVCSRVGLWNDLPTKQVFARFRQNSIVVPGAEVSSLCEAAADLKITICIGVSERVESGPGNGTLYNTLLTITPEGKIANSHRKLVPTYTERLVWGNGDGTGLGSVATPNGRVGGLICWEHWMPLARMAMHNTGEHIHVAVWPTVNDLHQLCSRHYAFEGRCFVLAVGLMMRSRDLPKELLSEADIENVTREWLERGGSSVIAPNASYVVEPLYDREELIIADLDLSDIDSELMTLDVSGHYARPDIFTFETKGR